MLHGAWRAIGYCLDMAETRTVAPPDLVARLRDLDADVGTTKAAERLGISRETFARLVGGLGVRRGTVALVVASFAARAAALEGSESTAQEKKTRAKAE
jgi:hypothetical protein